MCRQEALWKSNEKQPRTVVCLRATSVHKSFSAASLCVSDVCKRLDLLGFFCGGGGCNCILVYRCWTVSSQRASLPCPQARSACGSPCWGTPLWLAVTGRIRQEMQVHLPCVGAYLGLSWGTNSKASLCSSRSEGTGNHLSTLCITDNKGGQTLNTDCKLEDGSFRRYQKYRRGAAFVFKVSTQY